MDNFYKYYYDNSKDYNTKTNYHNNKKNNNNFNSKEANIFDGFQ